MKNFTLTLFVAIALTFSSFTQDLGEKTMTIIKECACREVVVNSRGVEKVYAGVWLESVKYEEGFIIFSKGDNIQRWNASKITFIDKGNGYIRIYLD